MFCDLLRGEFKKCVKQKFERLREHALVAQATDSMGGFKGIMKQSNSMNNRSRFVSKTSRKRSTELSISPSVKRLKKSSVLSEKISENE